MINYFVLVCEGMSDDPVEELENKTPLEIAKTPAIDRLANEGLTGGASFVPRGLPATGDIALMSILGYDPAEFYTGTAPLDALGYALTQKDNEIAFRADFVTVFEEALMDASSSHISPKESQALIDALNEKLGTGTMRFYSGSGHKNILMVSDASLTDHLDDLETVSPRTLVGKKITKELPRGKSAETLAAMIDKAKDILEAHEINRVRIDLGENPANFIWLWGQGKRPKLPSFHERFGLQAALSADTSFADGLAKAAGVALASSIGDLPDDRPVAVVYREYDDEVYRTNNLKSKIKLIEDFDATVVAPVVKRIGDRKDCRILITTDRAWSREKKSSLHGQVPFLLWGRGIAPAENNLYSEKAAAGSKLHFDNGHELMEHFLKKI